MSLARRVRAPVPLPRARLVDIARDAPRRSLGAGRRHAAEADAVRRVDGIC